MVRAIGRPSFFSPALFRRSGIGSPRILRTERRGRGFITSKRPAFTARPSFLSAVNCVLLTWLRKNRRRTLLPPSPFDLQRPVPVRLAAERFERRSVRFSNPHVRVSRPHIEPDHFGHRRPQLLHGRAQPIFV